jgi:hypothetical protein
MMAGSYTMMTAGTISSQTPERHASWLAASLAPVTRCLIAGDHQVMT